LDAGQTDLVRSVARTLNSAEGSADAILQPRRIAVSSRLLTHVGAMRSPN